jgi:hypothetical protein
MVVGCLLYYIEVKPPYPLSLDQPLLCATIGSSSLNVVIVVSAILVSSLAGLPERKSSGHPPNLVTSVSPGHRIWAVVEWDHVGRILLSGIVTWR